MAGVACDLYGDHYLAQTYYKQALGIDPENHRARTNYALSLAITRQYPEALNILMSIAEIEKTDSARLNVALVHVLSGQLHKAEPILKYLSAQAYADFMVQVAFFTRCQKQQKAPPLQVPVQEKIATVPPSDQRPMAAPEPAPKGESTVESVSAEGAEKESDPNEQRAAAEAYLPFVKKAAPTDAQKDGVTEAEGMTDLVMPQESTPAESVVPEEVAELRTSSQRRQILEQRSLEVAQFAEKPQVARVDHDTDNVSIEALDDVQNCQQDLSALNETIPAVMRSEVVPQKNTHGERVKSVGSVVCTPRRTPTEPEQVCAPDQPKAPNTQTIQDNMEMPETDTPTAACEDEGRVIFKRQKISRAYQAPIWRGQCWKAPR
jgi:hypothetical protein